MTHNRIQDQIAIAGVGSTGYSRKGGRTARSLAAEAAVKAIRDAGLSRADIDGVVSSAGMGSWTIVPPGATEMVAMLRLPEVTYFADGNAVIVSPLLDAMHALYSGACTAVLVYHYNFRTPFNSAKAAADPFRRNIRGYDSLPPENARNAAAYAAWASRYLHENPVQREHLGRIAVNSRTNAVGNPLAAMRTPLTLPDYLSARMVREPLGMLDMDLPVDGAEAFVLTTTERARDLRQVPVLVHNASQGLVETAGDEEQLGSLARHGQDVVARQLWARSERRLADADIAYIYDGFSFISLSWLEKLGWCGPGEAGKFLEDHWRDEQNRLLIDGRVPVNPQGGMLSEGGTQGAGFLRDAVHQLRGTAGERQIDGARTALLAIGGFFYNSQGAVLVRDDAR
ncbi:thiolase C-terminal domain-containing protein [Amycolatopsis pithecellobii]|uniref:Thiolase family protein n=1 Tax=Amycolatopsis pithecellobii TaxID=664692 RepID=A0A6N7YJU9_9PSEU|nr:thiolase family protein [Amycolatopsis pithecellobii]MTD53167.1 thiolase family protein [Amycolatopsis pithecellobii]